MASVMTNNALLIAMNRMYKATPDYTRPSVFKVGINQTTAQSTDTDLDQPVPISGTESVDTCEVVTGWTDSADMTISVNSSTYKEGDNALNLTKDATGSADASTSKTESSALDFTSKELSVWLYIIDSTALNLLATSSCLTIRFGSDSSNYYEWQKDKADLATGWNLITGLTSSNADTTTGTPTLTACDYIFIQLTGLAAGTTWSAGDFIMDDIKIISADDYTKTLTTGYPILDEDNFEVTIRGELSSIEANGYLLDGFGVFNSDSTPLMESIDDFTDESKGLTDNFIFTAKNTFTLV